MTRGTSAKGYKMTQNRRNILNLLIEEGGAVRSKEGRATSLMHGLLEHGGSLVSFNATLRELESLGFIERNVEGRRTYGIAITDKAREDLKTELVEAPAASPAESTAEAVTQNKAVAAAEVQTNGATAVVPVVDAAATEPEVNFDWDDKDLADPSQIPDSIDYDVLLGVFLKAALRGMEGPSTSELDYYKQQNETAMVRIQNLETEVEKLRVEAASAISERDQLQKNLNILMSRSEQKSSGRGSNPIRKLLKPEELAALDTLMRQVPSRRDT